MKPADFVAYLEKRKTLRGVPIKRLCRLTGDVFQHGSSKLAGRVMFYVWTEGTEADAAKFLKTAYDTLGKRVDFCGGALEIFNGESEAQVIKNLDEATRGIGDVWDAQRIANAK
jgi:hypothetical protein